MRKPISMGTGNRDPLIDAEDPRMTMPFKKHPLFASLLLLTLSGCIARSGIRPFPGELAQALQALVDGVVSAEGEDPIHNAVLLVESPRGRWKGAAGMADGRSEAMTADHQFKIASITKTFTATLILQLMEEGRLGLNDPIAEHLDDAVIQADRLHVFGGVPYGRRITVRHLLSHTSGIADYMEDPRFIPGVLADPQAGYTPERILARYYEYETNLHAAFPPGGGFNYSDVNFVLLAMMVERVTGDAYAHQLRVRIFDPLGLENSYLEHYEAPRGNRPLAHAYFSTLDLATEVNTSFDWGGGGIVSTCEDLNAFFRALQRGKLFQRAATLHMMLDAAEEGRGGTDYAYGLGIMKRVLHGLVFYGHGGAYDCDAYYCPAREIGVCMSLNQMNTHGKRDALLLAAIKLAAKE